MKPLFLMEVRESPALCPSGRGARDIPNPFTRRLNSDTTNPEQNETMQLITGNTYPVRQEIKALGGKWNPPRQGWEVPDDNAEQARALVAGSPSSPPRTGRGRASSRGRGSYVTRFSSGATLYTNRGGRCEDAPCCGCCS